LPTTTPKAAHRSHSMARIAVLSTCTGSLRPLRTSPRPDATCSMDYYGGLSKSSAALVRPEDEGRGRGGPTATKALRTENGDETERRAARRRATPPARRASEPTFKMPAAASTQELDRAQDRRHSGPSLLIIRTSPSTAVVHAMLVNLFNQLRRHQRLYVP
jgi:hypothetical protein